MGRETESSSALITPESVKAQIECDRRVVREMRESGLLPSFRKRKQDSQQAGKNK